MEGAATPAQKANDSESTIHSLLDIHGETFNLDRLDDDLSIVAIRLAD